MTDSYSILIIEDEKNILDFMARTLRSNGYKTITSETGQSGLSIINSHCPDLILLDLGLPDMDGNDIISSVRKWTSCPIIVISARAGEQDKVAALDLGADDYITKPFEIQEVLARIQVQLRHMQQEPEHKSVSYKNLELDRERFEVRIAGVLLPKITKQEFAILELLLEHPKQVFSKEEIFEYAWDEHYMGETKTLDVHISNIRKKIKAVTQEEYIDTVWGIGYRLHS